MSKQQTPGRVGVAQQLAHCAGCGTELPDSGPNPLGYDLRCDQCWRAMVAAEAAHSRTPHTRLEQLALLYGLLLRECYAPPLWDED